MPLTRRPEIVAPECDIALSGAITNRNALRSVGEAPLRDDQASPRDCAKLCSSSQLRCSPLLHLGSSTAPEHFASVRRLHGGKCQARRQGCIVTEYTLDGVGQAAQRETEPE